MKPIRSVETTMEDAVRLKFIQQPLSKAEVDRLIDLSYLP
jgi:hypothetical protein